MSIFAKLIKVQAQLKAPKNQYNNFGKYKYRNCEDIFEGLKPLLLGNGLSQIIVDDIEIINNVEYIKSTVTVYDVETDKSISCHAFAKLPKSKKGMDEAQITGACSSYARKYALNGMYSIDDTKDNDSDQPSKTKHQPQPQPQKGSIVVDRDVIQRIEIVKTVEELGNLKETLINGGMFNDQVKALLLKQHENIKNNVIEMEVTKAEIEWSTP